MNTTTQTTEPTLKTTFEELGMTVTDAEFNTAQEIVRLCKAQGETAYYTATAIINEFDLQPWYSALANSMIKHGLFRY